MDEYHCPVCKQEFDTPWEGSFDICPSCGIQFGYDEAGAATDPVVYEEWRKMWTENGRKSLDNQQESTLLKRIDARRSKDV